MTTYKVCIQNSRPEHVHQEFTWITVDAIGIIHAHEIIKRITNNYCEIIQIEKVLEGGSL